MKFEGPASLVPARLNCMGCLEMKDMNCFGENFLCALCNLGPKCEPGFCNIPNCSLPDCGRKAHVEKFRKRIGAQ